MPSCTCLQWGEKRKICKIIISSEISSNFMAGRQTPHPPIHLIALQCLLGPPSSFYHPPPAALAAIVRQWRFCCCWDFHSSHASNHSNMTNATQGNDARNSCNKQTNATIKLTNAVDGWSCQKMLHCCAAVLLQADNSVILQHLAYLWKYLVINVLRI